MKDTASAYNRLAAEYDRRWQTYLDETLGKAVSLVQGEPPGLFSLLDVGCGTGTFIQRLLSRFPQARFTGVEPSAGMLRRAREKLAQEPRVRLRQAFAEELPFSDGSFDAVSCLNCLHCFQDAGQAVGQMARVLKPGGRLVVMDWCRNSWSCRLLNRLCVWFDPTHVWMYTTQELQGLMARHGLRVIRTERFRAPWPDGFRLWEMALLIGVKG